MSKDVTSSTALPDARDAKSQLKPSEVLARAADLIEPEGKWCQHAGRRGDARCLAEAISSLAPASVIWGDLTGPLEAATGTCWIIDWNDEPGRTQAEAVAALRKASALAAEAGQ